MNMHPGAARRNGRRATATSALGSRHHTRNHHAHEFLRASTADGAP